MDFGYGNAVYNYLWDSEDGNLNNLVGYMYEYVTFTGSGVTIGGMFEYSNPPFIDESTRNPLRGDIPDGAGNDGRKPLYTGKNLDQHIPINKFRVPFYDVILGPISGNQSWMVTGNQSYRFHCQYVDVNGVTCDADEIIPGTHSGPHNFSRTFFPKTPWQWCDELTREYRYLFDKHGYSVWTDWKVGFPGTQMYFVRDSQGNIGP